MKPRNSRISALWVFVTGILRKVFSFLLLVLIYFYRVCISPLTPPSCRFTPTCSAYAVEEMYDPKNQSEYLKKAGAPA